MVRIVFVWLGVVVITATAAAQTNWVKYGYNPVLPAGNPGSWDQESFTGCILHEDSLYKMWYAGWDGSAGRLGYAISYDEVNWIKVDNVNPVIELGDPGEFDNVSVEAPCVIYDDGVYKMWYNGYGGSPAMNRIGYATSIDGIGWQKAYSDNPVLDAGPSAWDNSGVWSPHVVIDEGQYKMWYVGLNGSNSRIGYATSMDGINWTKVDSVNPVLNLGNPGGWEDYGLNDPVILLSDSIYQMWYMGHDGSTARIGYATSSDGINWVKDSLNNPVLTPGSWNSWDDFGVRGPEVLFETNVYKMWYTGIRHGDYVYGAGYAATGCNYTPGDVNGPGSYNGLDITYGVNFFKYGTPAPQCVACGLCPDWHYCGDVNASCNYNGLDITYGVNYFKFGNPAPVPCADCPPVE